MNKTLRGMVALPRAAIALVAVLAAACSQEITGGASSESGSVAIAITDAASSSIAQFEVEVTAIQLRRATGAPESVLNTATRVDLASLTDTSLLLASARVPNGLYTQATITIDLSAAQCVLANKTTPAVLLDANGNPLTGSLSVPLQLAAPFLVGTTAHRLLELDLDLDQSFSVDVVGNTVRFEPAFVLRVDPQSPRLVGTIGSLTAVAPNLSSFTGTVRGVGGVLVSNVVFQASGATIYQIDGVSLLGSAGIDRLATLPVDASLQCFGSIASSTGKIDVVYVEAGTGTYNGGSDIVEGHIVGRTGGPGSDAVLEVFGHSNDALHTTFQYGTTFLVNTSFANTKVVRRGSVASFDPDALNIGQRVRVFGTLTGTTMTANDTSSVIRIQPTRVVGNAAGAPSGTQLTFALTRVGLLDQSAFDWPDGGFMPVDPNVFKADIGALGVGQAINATSIVSAVGYFTNVGASGADFNAVALTNESTAPSLVLVRNRPNIGFTVVTTANASQIQLNIVGVPVAGEFAVVDSGAAGSIPLPSGPTPTVNHPGNTGFYSLRDRTSHTIRVYTRFSDFASALQSDIVQGATLIQLGAIGTYTQSINVIDAGIATAVVE
ncbi:MAG: DUF4382 domain-containing protein [Planctomycetes bacterium]|nr:DUF4382 domain-containing protein [Planctomycetota bacterium]